MEVGCEIAKLSGPDACPGSLLVPGGGARHQAGKTQEMEGFRRVAGGTKVGEKWRGRRGIRGGFA
jgi:hypothetical protein